MNLREQIRMIWWTVTGRPKCHCFLASRGPSGREQATHYEVESPWNHPNHAEEGLTAYAAKGGFFVFVYPKEAQGEPHGRP